MTPKDPTQIKKKSLITCAIQDCGRPVLALGLCVAHHRRYLRGKRLDTPVGFNKRDEGVVPVGTIRLSAEDAKFIEREAKLRDTSKTGLCTDIIEEWIASKRGH